MRYLTTNFKEFVREKLNEKLQENKMILKPNEPTKPVEDDKPLLFDFKEEFEKIMRDYDNL